MIGTTKGPSGATPRPFSTSGSSRSHHIPHTSKEYKDMTQSSDHPFTEGQKVRILPGRHAGKLGTVKEIDGGNIWVLADGAFTVAPYTPEELEPVRTDDTVPATDAEVTEYLTGVGPLAYVDPEDGVEGHGFSESDPHTCEMDEPHDGDHVCAECGETWGSVDQFRCPVEGCDTVLYATGRVADGEQDEYLEEVEEHRRSHAPKTVGDVSAIGLWLAIKDVAPELYDGLIAIVKTPAADAARALRVLADVLEEATR